MQSIVNKLNPFHWRLPFKLIAIIALVLLFGNSVSLDIKRFFLSVSQTLLAILVFVLPFIIFSYLSSCIISFKKGVLAFIFILFVVVYSSNVFSTMISYGASSIFLEDISRALDLSEGSNQILEPLWELRLPDLKIQPFTGENARPIGANEIALTFGLLIGLFLTFFRSEKAEYAINKLRDASHFFLSKMFIPLVPIFVLGFILKLDHDGVLAQTIKNYLPVYIFITCIQVSYILFLYGVAAKFKVSTWYTYIRNMVPAFIAGFSAMSSAAAMPLTLQGAERNTGNPTMARAIIPATVNIHMIGNATTVPILAMAVMLSFGLPFPDFSTYLIFGLSFGIAQFAVAAVPNGGIFVMLPILQQQFGFTPEMTAFISAIYILFDPNITGTNIVGNSALAVFLTRLYKKFKITGE